MNFCLGEGYIRNNTSIHTYLDIMTDDVEEKANTWPVMQSDIRGMGMVIFVGNRIRSIVLPGR